METKRTLLVELISKESVGINEDVIVLSEFVYNSTLKG